MNKPDFKKLAELIYYDNYSPERIIKELQSMYDTGFEDGKTSWWIQLDNDDGAIDDFTRLHGGYGGTDE